MSKIQTSRCYSTNFFETNPSLMENVPSKTAAEIYNEFEEKVEEFEDIVHVVDQLEEPPDAETISDPEDENIAKDALEDGDEALDENGTNGFKIKMIVYIYLFVCLLV